MKYIFLVMSLIFSLTVGAEEVKDDAAGLAELAGPLAIEGAKLVKGKYKYKYKDDKWAKAYKEGHESLLEARNVYKLFIKGKNKVKSFEEWQPVANKAQSIYKKCVESIPAYFSKCLEVQVKKEKNIDCPECLISLSKQFNAYNQARTVVDSCSKEKKPLNCIEKSKSSKTDCVECSVDLAKKVLSLGHCANIDQSKYKQEAELCEKYALSDHDYFDCTLIDDKNYPQKKAKCDQAKKDFRSFGMMGPVGIGGHNVGMGFPGFGGKGMIGLECSSDKGDGRVVCNGKTYKLDTSIKYGGRNIVKEIEKSDRKPSQTQSDTQAIGK